MLRPEKGLSSPSWVPHFDAKEYAKEIKEVSLKDREMGEVELRKFGIMVSKHRKELRDYAVEYDTALASNRDVDVD